MKLLMIMLGAHSRAWRQYSHHKLAFNIDKIIALAWVIRNEHLGAAIFSREEVPLMKAFIIYNITAAEC